MDISLFLSQVESNLKDINFKSSEVKNPILRKQHLIDNTNYDTFRHALSLIDKNEDRLTKNYLLKLSDKINHMKGDFDRAFIENSFVFSKRDGGLKFKHLGSVKEKEITISEVIKCKNLIEREETNIINRHQINEYDSKFTLNEFVNKLDEEKSFDEVHQLINSILTCYDTELTDESVLDDIDSFLFDEPLSKNLTKLDFEIDSWFHKK